MHTLEEKLIYLLNLTFFMTRKISKVLIYTAVAGLIAGSYQLGKQTKLDTGNVAHLRNQRDDLVQIINSQLDLAPGSTMCVERVSSQGAISTEYTFPLNFTD